MFTHFRFYMTRRIRFIWLEPHWSRWYSFHIITFAVFRFINRLRTTFSFVCSAHFINELQCNETNGKVSVATISCKPFLNWSHLTLIIAKTLTSCSILWCFVTKKRLQTTKKAWRPMQLLPEVQTILKSTTNIYGFI